MYLAQGHNAVTPVRLKPATPWSRVKHSTTEPLRSLLLRKTHFFIPGGTQCVDIRYCPQVGVFFHGKRCRTHTVDSKE